MRFEEFRVYFTASKCVYFPLNHELEVSNNFTIQTECSSLIATIFERTATNCKREVKVAGYWPSSFFCVFMDRDEVEVHKNAKKKDEANIQPS